tara:strand:- start:106 stop:3429 length:3324 start_codon:yes stop_codon:yes gene_type:complete
MINFSEKYDRKKFKNFLKDFLPEDLLENDQELQIDDNDDYFKKASILGSVKSLDDIVILEVERSKAEKTRLNITKRLFKLLDTHSYSKALVVTFSKNESHYRFSLISSDFVWEGTKVNKKFSNPKRLSFLLGEGAKLHTPHNKLNTKILNYEDLFSRFNIEIVNDEFFENYKKLFLNLQNKIENDKIFNKFLKDKNITSDFFSKRLLGQIVFCYFLQKKKWLGVSKNNKFGTGDPNYLRNIFNIFDKKKENFFNKFLEFFFYEGLNNQNENNFVKSINIKVPYVGGGLFEYFEGYDWENENLNIPNSFFSNSKKDGILDIFDLYNFTVDEHEDYDIELAVDPEMLGRVFENLLPENIRKGGGSYYTPRIIVNYMCEKSLSQFLYGKFQDTLSLDKIDSFIKDRNFNISKEKTFISNADKIDKALQDLKICDPSIGSGAFAVGIVNLVSRLRFLLINHVSRKYKNNRYFFKRNCVQNSIYGVDIDSSAVEIAKLRLWLTLIVEKDNYEDTEPLPNLDFQLIQGNSLIDEVDGFNFQHLDIKDKDYQFELLPNDVWDEFSKTKEKFIDLKKKYLDLKSFKKKKILREEIEAILPKITELAFSLGGDWKNKQKSDYKIFNKIHANKNFFLWKLYFIEIFQNQPGFDIVIGNPPYIGEKDNKSKFQDVRNSSSLKKFYQGKMDLFYFFFHLGINLIKEGGVLSFITTNYFVTALGAKKLREDFKNRTEIKKLINFKELKVFPSARGQHNLITILKKDSSGNKSNVSIINCNYEGAASDFLLQDIFHETNSSCEYIDIESKNVFEGNESYIRLSGQSNSKTLTSNILNKISNECFPLNLYTHIKQGIVSGADKVTDKHLEKFKIKAKKGEGIFALSNLEVEQLKLNNLEKELIKNFYKNSDISRFCINLSTDNKVVYVTKNTKISKYPNIQKHLEKFKIILKKRLITYKESYPWFSLHRPRNINILTNTKIVCPRRSKLNNFAIENGKNFEQSDIMMIAIKDNYKKTLDYEYLLGMLNSKLFFFWLSYRGKVKGNTLELYGKPLEELPIKIFDKKLSEEVIKITKKLVEKFSDVEFERLNQTIYKLYKLSKKEEEVVEDLYSKIKFTSNSLQ